jgi:hypothetical protein
MLILNIFNNVPSSMWNLRNKDCIAKIPLLIIIIYFTFINFLYSLDEFQASKKDIISDYKL